jgi:zinc protease
VVVTGDVVPEEVHALAQGAYGALGASPAIKVRVRPQEPEHRAPRRVDLKDPRAGNASMRRFYLAPSYRTAAEPESEALHLLMKIAGHGTTSRLFQKLVVEEKVASSAGGWYTGSGLDSGMIGAYAVAAQGVGLDRVEAAIDRVLAELREQPVTTAELERAKKAFIADFIYESDSQQALARRYGEGLTLGLTLQQINDWPAAVAKVTPEQITQVARKYLDIRRSVTGTLVPAPSEPEGGSAARPAPAGRT